MTDTADKLLRRALEVLESAGALGFGHPPIGKEIRAYLDAPKDEPDVAWMDEPVAYIDGPNQMLVWAKPFQYNGPKSIKVEPIPLYLHPPTKTAPMKPMTEEAEDEAFNSASKYAAWLETENRILREARKPMTEEEIKEAHKDSNCYVLSCVDPLCNFSSGVRFAERHHFGIGERDE